MNLKQQPGFKSSFANQPVQPEHSQLDNIGSRTLNRCVAGHPFRKAPPAIIGGAKLRKVTSPIKESRYKPQLFCLVNGLLKIRFDSLVPFKVTVNIFSGLLPGNTQLLG